MRNRQSDHMGQAFQVFLISPRSQTRAVLLNNLTTIVFDFFSSEPFRVLASITPSRTKDSGLRRQRRKKHTIIFLNQSKLVHSQVASLNIYIYYDN